MNGLTGLQIIAANELQNGSGLSAPDITANYSAYLSFLPVSNYLSIYNGINSNPNIAISSANANILISLGSNSFPVLFDQVPFESTSKLGYGPMIEIAYRNTSNLFANGANSYIQSLTVAQSYAATAQTTLQSAATAQWVGGPQSSITGGFSNIGGNDATSFCNIANVISEMGTLMNPSIAYTGFSNAECFKEILNTDKTIGNLHKNFFGKTIFDPVTKSNMIINEKLFDYIIGNPSGKTSDDSFQIVALNPLDEILGNMANIALQDIGDLDAVVTYFNIGPSIASNIYYWSDCLNLKILFGSLYDTVQKNIGDTLDTYSFIQTLVNSISGLSKLQSLTEVGNAMSKITPLQNTNLIMVMSQPVSANMYANLQASFGNGSGTYGNPTVDDILGGTNYNDVISNCISVLSPLIYTNDYANIVADSSNIANAISGTVTYPIILSNGTSCDTLDILAGACGNLINNTALNLYSKTFPSSPSSSLSSGSSTNSIASTVAEISSIAGVAAIGLSMISSFSSLASSHNLSMSFSSGEVKDFAKTILGAVASNVLADLKSMDALYKLVVSIVFSVWEASINVNMDMIPKPPMLLKCPNPSSILKSFPSMLASLSALESQIPMANEISGLSNITNCLNMASLGGQALSGVMTEAKNINALSASGLSSSAYSSASAVISSGKNKI
jgi:hypothetical protein